MFTELIHGKKGFDIESEKKKQTAVHDESEVKGEQQ